MKFEDPHFFPVSILDKDKSYIRDNDTFLIQVVIWKDCLRNKYKRDIKNYYEREHKEIRKKLRTSDLKAKRMQKQ